MNLCPKCGNKYEIPTVYCLVDGTMLVKHDPQADTLRQEIPTIFEYKEIKRVPIGSYCDIEFRHRKFRIVVVTVSTEPLDTSIRAVSDNPKPRKEPKETEVQLNVNTGGGLVYGGRKTKELKTNEFLVPLHRHEEELNSIYAFNFQLTHTFFRVYVEHVDFHSLTVDLNIIILAD